jgi:hypothetical protein
MDAPPSRTEWALEGELRGHTPAETIAWASWTADFEDGQVQRRALPVGVILAGDCEPRWVTRIRSWFGR